VKATNHAFPSVEPLPCRLYLIWLCDSDNWDGSVVRNASGGLLQAVIAY
jgi:hypothetical protein